MSKDIRSFFNAVNKKTSQPISASNSKKRPAIISDSSDEEVPATPVEKCKTTKKRKIANGTEIDKSPKVKNGGSAKKDKKSSPTKLKPISALEMFKSSPKNSKKEKKPEKQETVEDMFMKEEDVFSDEDFKATLLQVDEVVGKKEKNNEKSSNSKNNNHSSENEKIKSSKVKLENDSEDDKIKSPKVKSKNDSQDSKIKSPKKDSEDDKIKSPKPKIKTEKESKKLNGSKLDSLGASSDDQKYSSNNDDSLCDTSQDIIEKTPKARKRKADLDETITDEDRFERRRQSSVMYQKYLKRAGPSNPGSKEVPQGTPDCLKPLVFLLTGVYESLERDEAASIITDLGGRVVKAISGKVTHLVVGEDAGPAKLDKAKSMGIKIISEDGLLDLIRERSSDSKKSGSDSKETKDIKSKKIKTSEEKSKDTKSEESNKKTPKKHKEAENKKSEVSASPPKKKMIELPKEKSTKTSPTKSKESEEVSEFFKKDKPKIKLENVDKSESRETEKHVPKSESIISDNVSWVDKYKPKTLKQIIGQQGENSNVKKLIKWMENWYKNRNPKLKLTKPSPWAKNDDGAYFKAALLSGPPGVGKTTTASLVSTELGFDVVEMNASCTRSKSLLREDVSNLLSNQSLAGYFNGSEKGMTRKHVLLMDEVDGMAGNEDRGGMQELIQLIKNSSIPIICMCNDRNHPKIRSLVNYCFDLKFSKPRVEQIRGAMMSVCYKENIKIKPEVLDQIISGTQNDIRQTLNNLSMWVDDNISLETAKDKANNSKKDIKLGPWDVVRKVFSEEEQKKTNIHQRSSLFFHDYSMAPLFVQENYLNVIPHCDKKEWLDRFTETAEYLSLGDLADSRIRKNGAWSLLPLQAMYSSVAPGHLLSGHFGGQINFPSWLGKTSKRNKFLRMLSELQIHMRLSTSGSLQAVNLDYLPYIKNSLIKPLQAGNVDEAIQIMQNYHLLREDLENIVELSLWPKQKDPLALINGKVKAAFTRQYNKECQLVSSVVTKKRANIPLDQENEYDEENEDQINSENENEDDDDITKDSTIKAKKVLKPEKGETSSKKKKTAETTEKPKKSRVSKKK